MFEFDTDALDKLTAKICGAAASQTLTRTALMRYTMLYDAKTLANLIVYWGTTIVGMWCLNDSIVNGLRLDIPRLEGAQEAAVRLAPDDCKEAGHLAYDFIEYTSQDKLEEVGKLVAQMHRQSILVDAIAVLAHMMVSTRRAMHGLKRDSVMRAVYLRLQMVKARQKLINAEWCGECLKHTMDIAEALDDRRVQRPMDDLFGK